MSIGYRMSHSVHQFPSYDIAITYFFNINKATSVIACCHISEYVLLLELLW